MGESIAGLREEVAELRACLDELRLDRGLLATRTTPLWEFLQLTVAIVLGLVLIAGILYVVIRL